MEEALIDDQHVAETTETSHRWWTIGLSEMVPQGEPVAVRCDTTELVCFREIDGTVRSLVDQCAHRRAPLSLGKIGEDGMIECPYHGWQYNGGTGRCVKIPNLSSTERVPGTYRVPVFSTLERDGFIHIWSGDGEEPIGELPSLALSKLDTENIDSRLLAFPKDALIDLLLDAPGAVLDLGRLRIINEHRFGDPVLADNVITVLYAVVDETVEPGVLVSEYPFQLEIKLDLMSNAATVRLIEDSGTLIANAVITVLSVKNVLCTLALRGSHVLNAESGSPHKIGLNEAIDPQVALEAVDYVSRLRKNLPE